MHNALPTCGPKLLKGFFKTRGCSYNAIFKRAWILIAWPVERSNYILIEFS
jgi:hypothetical protein